MISGLHYSYFKRYQGLSSLTRNQGLIKFGYQLVFIDTLCTIGFEILNIEDSIHVPAVASLMFLFMVIWIIEPCLPFSQNWQLLSPFHSKILSLCLYLPFFVYPNININGSSAEHMILMSFFLASAKDTILVSTFVVSLVSSDFILDGLFGGAL